ncbi:MAG: helix-turn-helix domain-containing protein [Ignavibacteriae bacterium]|nr:helix-turn-helix domain-containing protein [Ignavibacteriota bacterium]
MHLKFYEVLNLLSIAWLLFFSAYLYVTNRGNKHSNFFLASLLLTNALFNLFPLVKNFIVINYSQFIFFLYLAASTGFLFGPFIYFYTKSLTNKDFKLTLNLITHFLPYSISLFYFYFESYIKFLQPYYLTILYSHIFIYIYFSYKNLIQFNRHIKNQFSETYKFHLNRLFIILLVFSALWILDIFLIVQRYFEILPLEYQSLIIYTLFIINLLFAIFIVFDSLSHPELLSISLSKYHTEKYKSSTLNDADKQYYINKLESIMKNGEPYLNANLNIKELSDISEIPVRILSQIINESIGMNFYDYINSHRIEHSKNLLKSKSEKNILEILYDSGFNTKSAFNSAFKKFTKMTPSEFRKNN